MFLNVYKNDAIYINHGVLNFHLDHVGMYGIFCQQRQRTFPLLLDPETGSLRAHVVNRKLGIQHE